MPYVYILECSDRTTYVGSTWNLNRRMEQHQQGEGSIYTRTRLPVRLLYSEYYDRIAEAHGREKQIQGWSRSKRLALVRGQTESLTPLSRKVNWSKDDDARDVSRETETVDGLAD